MQLSNPYGWGWFAGVRNRINEIRGQALSLGSQEDAPPIDTWRLNAVALAQTAVREMDNFKAFLYQPESGVTREGMCSWQRRLDF